jgi:cbb3-type cytochrome oxidase subunit 1
VPMWVMTASVTASIAMFIPTCATMINFGGTAWGTWAIMKRDIGYRFSLLAYVAYVGASLWGTVLAVMSLNAKLHFTNMTIAHVHLGFLGFGVPGLIAFTYFYLERSLKLKYSRNLAEWHFWLTAIGIIGYVVSMGISGWVEGTAWEAGGSPQSTMIDRYPYHVARAISGLIALLGQFLFVINVYKTVNYPISLQQTPTDSPEQQQVTA